MPEADVVYSDVKFTRANTNAGGSQQKGGSKVKTERVALVVLSALLAAAVIALGVTTQLQRERSCRTVQQTCPEPPPVKNESCLKCEEGWEQHAGKCYSFSTNKSSWNESRDECRQQGGDLVKIDSREEQKFLELKVRDEMNYDEDKFWIGLTDSKEEGTWLWADGSPLNTSLSFWLGKDPDNWTVEDPDGEDCVRMGEKAGTPDLKCWLDKSCKRPHRSICEKPATSGRVTCICS